jgi:hypothetical protein
MTRVVRILFEPSALVVVVVINCDPSGRSVTFIVGGGGLAGALGAAGAVTAGLVALAGAVTLFAGVAFGAGFVAAVGAASVDFVVWVVDAGTVGVGVAADCACCVNSELKKAAIGRMFMNCANTLLFCDKPFDVLRLCGVWTNVKPVTGSTSKRELWAAVWVELDGILPKACVEVVCAGNARLLLDKPNVSPSVVVLPKLVVFTFWLPSEVPMVGAFVPTNPIKDCNNAWLLPCPVLSKLLTELVLKRLLPNTLLLAKVALLV